MLSKYFFHKQIKFICSFSKGKGIPGQGQGGRVVPLQRSQESDVTRC